MSGIISYVKRIGVWLCIVIACEMIMIITMMLNKIPFAEIGYGIFSVCSLSNLFFRFHTTTLTEACSNELKQHHL